MQIKCKHSSALQCVWTIINRNQINQKQKSNYSEIDQASPNPSNVDVPLPSSSMIISESEEADWKSTIS